VRFLVLMAEEDHFDRWEAASEEQQQAFFDGLATYTAAVRERGQLLLGGALDRPGHASTLRDGSLTDGPYAETVEQVGGFYVVEVADEDEAIAIANEMPRSPGLVAEVLPTSAV
jgi:hypothetical protein